MKQKQSTASLIKGYLPVRIRFPPLFNYSEDSRLDETFLYIKENQDHGNKQQQGTIIFVANAPVYPSISTKLLLQSIFGRFGCEISRITVLPHPRSSSTASTSCWTTKYQVPCCLKLLPQGSFAHIVFNSHKDMKKTLQALTKLMTEAVASLSLDKIELQTLADREEEEEGQFSHNGKESLKKSDAAAARIADRYRSTRAKLVHDDLMQECNAVMEEFETAEEEEKRKREAAKNQPDEDGFITVTYETKTPKDLESSDNAHLGRKKSGAKRSRKKKGPKELSDFYRFQTKEHRKKSLQELRKKFEEDLQKVQKLKEEKQYRPF